MYRHWVMPSRWTALPANRSKAPVLQVRLFLVLGVLGIAALLGLISTFAWLNVKPTPPTPTPQTQSASETVATNYLLGQNTVVPVAPPATNGDGIQWTLDQSLGLSPTSVKGPRDLYSLVLDKSGNHPNGYTVTTYGVTGDISYVETDYYIAVTNYGTFVVSVPMYITSAGAQLAALPALTPYTPTASGNNSGLDYHIYAGYEAPTAAMSDALQDWASAYVTGNPSLDSVVAPPNITDPNYQSLSGFSLVPGSATAIGAVPGTGAYVDYVYLRARLAIRSSSANGVTLTMDYDLMLQETTVQPTYKVVAWGPAGSAASLVPYQTNLPANQ